ncbi:hypothetical protein GCM10011610_23920 [Nocardia rhizosphaerihabitans]|uniref:Uncharacterized protein n=1 Tax=Nocardia rhizosphaerihabitans TaxID=1691570 RepID=A0ABQ2KAH7_9NOCA|nr:hypothetical protein GCM10011610_23920 [Nocardia rhizosphaerihabitans]
MAIVNGASPCIPVARSTTRHDTIEPAPEDGSHSRLSDAHDEQPAASGAYSLSQPVHRRIINVSCPCRAVTSPGLPQFAGSGGYIEASVRVY